MAAGAPLPLKVTITNRLPGDIAFHGFGVEPTDWNAETVSLGPVDIYRDGESRSLFLAAPKVVRPLQVAGWSRTAIPPGESLTIATDLRKWSIVGGWIPGRYRVTVRVSNLSLDAFTTAGVVSEPFELVVK